MARKRRLSPLQQKDLLHNTGTIKDTKLFFYIVFPFICFIFFLNFLRYMFYTLIYLIKLLIKYAQV
jgi:hypothetical protein